MLEDLEGYVEHALPLDAIVIDSPWESQYNTWRFNPFQFPDPKRLVGRLREAGVRTVVWVTPWVNLDSTDGQRPDDPGSERLHTRPAANYAEGAWGGHFVRGADGRPWVGRWWMGSGSLVDFTSPAARRWWRRQARAVLELGIEGIKADDGEGYYVPPDARFADGRSRRRGRLALRRALPPDHAEGARRRPPASGVLFGRSGWAGQQATGITWGGDQASDFWSLRALVAATLTAGGQRLLQLVARRRGLPRPPPGGALPSRAAPALGAVRLLHAADARPRSLRAGSLALRPNGRFAPTATTCCSTSG